jgi:hypothetical protein
LITITTNDISIEAELGGNETADALIATLPVTANANRWGKEIYFDCPVDSQSGDMKQSMDIGDIGYWVEGGAVAIFFGPTPASIDERPRAAVPVILVGRVVGDAATLDAIADGESITLALKS